MSDPAVSLADLERLSLAQAKALPQGIRRSLCRLATSVPPPRLHTVKYAGVLAPASPWRSRLAPQLLEATDAGDKPGKLAHAGAYRPWAELLARTFAVDVLAWPMRAGVGLAVR